MTDRKLEPFAEELTMVFLGNLNAAIFNPDWFSRHGLIGAEAAAEAKVSVISPQVTEIDFGHISLNCDEGRLVLRTTRVTHSEMLFDLGRGILRTLPHTPLTAAGINNAVHFKVSSENRWHEIGHTLAPKMPVWDDLCERPGMLSLTVQSPRSDWDYHLEENLVVEPYPRRSNKHPAIVVRANTHFTIGEDLLTKTSVATDLAYEFVESQWSKATLRGRVVAQKILDSITS